MSLTKKVFFGLVGVMMMIIGGGLFRESVSAFSVSPMKQTISLVPGQTYSNNVIVSSPLDTGKNTHYEVSIVPFKVNDKDGDYSIDLNGSDERNEIVKWVTLSDGTNSVKSGSKIVGDLAPGEKISFIYTIDVPESVMGGGQYFAVLVTSIPSSADGSDNNLMISETHSIASVVYAELPGKIEYDGLLRDNSINGFLFNPPITASFIAQNTGNTHFEVTYYLQVYPLFSNEEIFTTEENPSTDYVLPGTSRFVSQTWYETPAIGIFKVRQTAYYDFAKDKPSVTEKIVIVCPIYLLFLIIFVIILIISWGVYRAKSRSNKNTRAE